MSRRESGRLGSAFLLSAVIHVVVIGGAWYLGSRNPVTPPMRVYAVNIVSPPPQAFGEPSPEPQPAPPEPEPEVEPETPEVETPEPEPAPPAPPPPPPPPERAAASQPTPPPAAPPRQAPAPPPPSPPAAERPPQQASTGARPDPTSPGGEDINLQLRGVQCPSPDYCNNIIRQINRYFRSPGGTGEADILFAINRDGSVSNLRLQSSTGGAAFRLAVLEAVEQAGINRAFGPLPAAYRADQLPVSFYFRPAR